jgi:hypothetical protein
MASIRWSVLIQVVILLFASSPAWTEAKIDAKTSKRFKVNWSSIRYHTSLSIQRTSPKKQEATNRLHLLCEIEILDPDLVLGTTREGVMTQLTDPNGQNIPATSPLVRRGSMHMRYEGLQYRRRYVRPPQPNRWLSRIQSALKLPKRPQPRPEWINELQPSRMQVQLDAELSKLTGGEIKRMEGHFYALTAESIEHIYVPFKPNENWVRLTPDVEIKVTEAWCKNSSYHLRTEARPRGGASSRPYTIETYLPNRIVVHRQLIGPKGKIIQDSGGYRRLPAHMSGSSSGSGGDYGQVEKIRYIIAVNPTHYKIPFEFEHIPLPKP